MALASEFDLHPLAVKDAVHGDTRSKLEMFGDDLLMSHFHRLRRGARGTD